MGMESIIFTLILNLSTRVNIRTYQNLTQHSSWDHMISSINNIAGPQEVRQMITFHLSLTRVLLLNTRILRAILVERVLCLLIRQINKVPEVAGLAMSIQA